MTKTMMQKSDEIRNAGTQLASSSSMNIVLAKSVLKNFEGIIRSISLNEGTLKQIKIPTFVTQHLQKAQDAMDDAASALESFLDEQG